MTLSEVKTIIENHLNEIKPMFTDDVELSFIMRHPENKGCHLIISNDDLTELGDLILLEAEKLEDKKVNALELDVHTKGGE